MRPRLPEGRQLALTWSIPDEFGGMTRAMLRRSRAFTRLADRPVDVLTFDARPDYPAVEARLRACGELIDGLRLLNLYDWLREYPLPGGRLDLTDQPFTPLGPGQWQAECSRDGMVTSRVRMAADGETVLQIDHLRGDGSLLLTDRRDVRERGLPGGRSVVLCDELGTPVRSWSRIWRLYRAWLDALTAGERAFLLVDSKTAARFVAGYHRPNVATIHVVHGCHLADPERADSGFSAVRRFVFERLDQFDAVAVLSDRQRREIGAGHVRVVPNAATLGIPSPARRDPGHGVVVAALNRRKRVDHAVRAAMAAGVPRLDVYGDGPERGRIEALATAAIRLHGHDPAAAGAFTRASFAVLTGRSEGFPLVLVEAMSAGCIPVAYDVRYGPADLIRHRRNGYLVPSGDREALASALREVQRLRPGELQRMRRRAQRAAARFTDERVIRRWAWMLRTARRRSRARRGRGGGEGGRWLSVNRRPGAGTPGSGPHVAMRRTPPTAPTPR